MKPYASAGWRTPDLRRRVFRKNIFELGDERPRLLGANALPGRCLFAPDLRLDRIERGDARQDRLGDGRARLRRGGDDLAPTMAPTQGERGASVALGARQTMIAGIAGGVDASLAPNNARFVAVESAEKHASSMAFKIRDLLVRQRTQTIS
jgi:hypothetical protein